MKKPWAGRFTGATAPGVEAFTQSISFDARLAMYDIEGSCAHALMLAHIGVLTEADAEKIVTGLRGIADDIAAGAVEFTPVLEDIHMNIEALLTDRIGPVAGKLHTGRSRNDQVALDTRLWLRDRTGELQNALTALQCALTECAAENRELVMPGFTHLQFAMPVLAAHHLLAYVEMFERDYQRLDDLLPRINVLPLGAGALAGSGFDLDREFVAEKLGFAAVSRNSMDTVADRDYIIEFAAAAAMIGMHLSRLAEDLVIWMSQPYGFINIPDAFCTGSSLMPNKKNPDVCELVRGKTARLYGDLTALLTLMKGTPMAYNRDFQEDKEPLFDSADTALACVSIMAEMIPGVTFIRDRLAAAVSDDFLLATDWTEHLVRGGMPFREAHECVGRAVAAAMEKGAGLTGLSLEELTGISPAFDGEILTIAGAAQSVDAKKTAGSTAPSRVADELARWSVALAGRTPKKCMFE